MKGSRFYMWGERGIIATFFADMHLWASAEDWTNFLASISISAKNFPSTLDEVLIIVEPDFGNRGFGHPDLVLALRHGDHRSVILFEAKRVPYLQACRKKRGDQYYNSTLKGQLELNYILSTALSLYSEHDGLLKQPEWVKRTPYAIGSVRDMRRY